MLDWAADEGWNPGLDDAEVFRAAGPDGFFVAVIGDRPVAAISVVNHAPDFAFLGLCICAPEHRGRGAGFALWSHALAHAGSRTVGLDGVPAQRANHARSGFVRAGRTRHLQRPVQAPEASAEIAQPAERDALIGLDAAANGVRRPDVLRAWTAPGARGKTILQREGGRIVGFATGRQCSAGCKVGPIIAPDAEAGVALAERAAAVVGQSAVIVDVPDHAQEMDARLRVRGLVETVSTARMHRGPAPTPGPALQAIAMMKLGERGDHAPVPAAAHAPMQAGTHAGRGRSRRPRVLRRRAGQDGAT